MFLHHGVGVELLISVTGKGVSVSVHGMSEGVIENISDGVKVGVSVGGMGVLLGV